ncbi:MAG: pyrimidine 5'-nucleotidase [Anaerolinea sp.]|nr:pyrimidine 5'-nucleotidase [Anaerolinea sp.]
MFSKSILFFDLDDTLYPPNNNLWDSISQRMERYIQEKFGLTAEQASKLRETLYCTYGTTLRGLQATYHIDEIEYLNYVHDVPLEQYIHPNPDLRALLQRYPQPKIVFTNADQAHAQRVLNRLGIRDIFDAIYDILAIAPYCKPMPEAFEIVLQQTGADPTASVFIDDMPKTLQTARQLGFTTVLVGERQQSDIAHFCIPSILDLSKVLPPPQ